MSTTKPVVKAQMSETRKKL